MVSTNLLVDIITYMTNQSVIAGPLPDGDTVYGTMLDKPDHLISLIEYPGVSAFMAAFGLRSIQVNVRDNNNSIALSKAWDIYNLFHKENIEDRIIQLTFTRWAIFSCRQSPFKLKDDESKRAIYVFNMGVTAKDET